jgi:pantoate--beta-alanine ligase
MGRESSVQVLHLSYFQIADETTLQPCLRKSKLKNTALFIAVTVNIRLIDTISLN